MDFAGALASTLATCRSEDILLYSAASGSPGGAVHADIPDVDVDRVGTAVSRRCAGLECARYQILEP
jgi:hypothetical protein